MADTIKSTADPTKHGFIVVNPDGSNISAGGGGGDATAANQVIGNDSLASIDGKITAVNTGAVVVSSSALPSGAATAAKQPALGTAGSASSDVITVQGTNSMTPLIVDFNLIPQPISSSALNSIDSKITAVNTGAVVVSSSALPSGAAIAAKQPSLGVAGTASSDVVTVQGITSMTPLKVDGSDFPLPAGGNTIGNVNLNSGTNIIGKVRIVDGGNEEIEVVGSGDGLSETLMLVTSDRLFGFNGATWDRLRSDTTNGLDVDVTRSALPTGASTLAEQQTQTTHLATIAGDTTDIEAAVEIMDDWDNAASDGASVSGDVAHDSADAGEPVKIGGKAVSAEPTAVTANDRVNAIFDLVGKQIMLPYSNPENFVSGAITSAMTGTTSTLLIAAPAAGLRNYLTTIIVSNSHATVGTDVVIQDGNGGATLLTIPAAAVYGGATVTLPTPLRQPTTATAIYCANITTGASTKVSAVGYKGV